MLGTLFFFVMVVSLFPLSVGPETRLLRSIAPGVVWVAALLASMLSLGRLFAEDYADGTLEQMLLTPQPIYLLVLGKVLAQWLVCADPSAVDGAAARCAVRSVGRCAARTDGVVDAGHAGHPADRIDWRGADAWGCAAPAR